MIKMKSEYSISIGIHPKIQFSNNNSIYQVNLKFIIARFSRRKMISFSRSGLRLARLLVATIPA